MSEPDDLPSRRVGRWTVLVVFAGLLLGALLGTWAATTAAAHLGGYRSGEISRTGTAEVTHCRTGLWLIQVCQARVVWDDETVDEAVRVEGLQPRTGTVAVAEHRHLTYMWASAWEESVVLMEDVPAGRHNGLWSIGIHLAMVIGAVVGLVAAVKLRAAFDRSGRGQ